MSTPELLEVGASLGLIVGVWFALMGWKLVALTRTHRPNRAEAPYTQSG